MKLKTRLKTLVLVIPIVFIFFYMSFYFLNSPPPVDHSQSYFIIQRGESAAEIARNLKNRGYIRSELFFTTLAMVNDKAGQIKSGEYSIDYTMKCTEIIDIISRGEVINQRFTIPEGYTLKQIAVVLEKNGLVNSEDFINACRDPDLLQKYGIPFNTAEGFLFPDTYFTAKGLDARQIADIMIDKFFENLHSITSQEYTKEQLKKWVIIASLVEKEAKIKSERPLIAAVFYNRLEKGKRLESCATVQYILEKPKERLLYKDLRVNSPYNTYLHTGLPPGPISNPGRDSLKAAVYPADKEYLFFVSKNDGSHYFSKTYQEHMKAIRKYNKSGGVKHQVS